MLRVSERLQSRCCTRDGRWIQTARWEVVESRTVLPSMMGSLAHCSDLPQSARNFAGAVVTKKVVGLGEFVNKESLKVVSVRI